MKLREGRHGHIHVLHLTGELDMHRAPDLRSVFRAKAESACPALIVELSGVDFIDSTGIAVLIEYLRDSAAFGGQFCVAGLTGTLSNSFDIVGLDKAIPIFDTVEEAVDALRDGYPNVPEPLFGDAHRHPLQSRSLAKSFAMGSMTEVEKRSASSSPFAE
ncbi:MAG: STAS domain-containing protein [Verrucomicrobia bacterium]|nr:STAS domain-containing protein [Verrucomicrobiota bacterium]